MNFLNLFELEEEIVVMDIGASAINEDPIYKSLLNDNFAQLIAFEGDLDQIQKMHEAFGKNNVIFFNHFLFDGGKHDVYFCAPESGMTSLYKPKKSALKFFNGFSVFGDVKYKEKVQTTRLDDIQEINRIDFAKMDVQGAELEIIKNGSQKLKNCLAFQLEVSYFPLYEGQPTFGQIDIYLRKLGYVPHMFLEVKRWSISPTIFQNNFRVPGNQLLESDVVYVKDPLQLENLSDLDLKKLILLSHFCFKSFDYSVYLLIELEKRNAIAAGSHKTYLGKL